MATLQEFLAGDATDHVVVFVAEDALDDADALASHGSRTEEGVVIVVEGERGRSVFQAATGMDAMQFSSLAMGNPGTVADDLSHGECPDAGGEDGEDSPAGDEDHAVRFGFAFSEDQNEEAGGIYAEGDVVHAYVQCSCGTAYSDRWVAGQR